MLIVIFLQVRLQAKFTVRMRSLVEKRLRAAGRPYVRSSAGRCAVAVVRCCRSFMLSSSFRSSSARAVTPADAAWHRVECSGMLIAGLKRTFGLRLAMEAHPKIADAEIHKLCRC